MYRRTTLTSAAAALLLAVTSAPHAVTAQLSKITVATYSDSGCTTAETAQLFDGSSASINGGGCNVYGSSFSFQANCFGSSSTSTWAFGSWRDNNCKSGLDTIICLIAS